LNIETRCLQVEMYQTSIQHWLPTACETEAMAQEWAAVLRYGTSIFEYGEIAVDCEEHDRDQVVRVFMCGVGQTASRKNQYKAILNSYSIPRDIIVWGAESITSMTTYKDAPIDWEYVKEENNRLLMYLEKYGQHGLSLCNHCGEVEYFNPCACWDNDSDVLVSANAVRGGGLCSKLLTPAQLGRKIKRNEARQTAFDESLRQRDPYRDVRLDFLCEIASNEALLLKLTQDPIKEITFVNGCEEEKNNMPFWSSLGEDDLFELKKDGTDVVTTKKARTRSVLCFFFVG